jgi:hypothetical protein
MVSVLLLAACIERPTQLPAPEPPPPTQTPAPEPGPTPTPEPVAQPEPEPAAGPLATLSGRKVWMVNASEEACARARSLGLEVECESSRPGAMREEIVCWCPDISPAALSALSEALSVPGFALRSWSDQPAEADPEECGTFAEITIRY